MRLLRRHIQVSAFLLTSVVASIVPVAASAQSAPEIPDVDEEEVTTKTATKAAVDERRQPNLSEDESQPPSHPTAAEVEAATTPEQIQALALRELELFVGAAESFKNDIRDVIRIRYNAQREQIAGRFDREIDDLEVLERSRRLEAIARFEAFLKKYPSDPDYSPDAMFRLAELYFEKSSDEYLVSSQTFEDQLAAFDAGELSREPPPPKPDYGPTISLYNNLIQRFPTYRHADAARYLLGYSYGEMGEDERSLELYSELVQEHTSSKFLPEVLTRIGEIYFDKNTRGSIQKAIDHYARVLPFKDSPYFDKALYKLAWAYYRIDAFEDSVNRFIDLVEFADEQKKLTGRSGSELRAEALQYIAISLADEEWGGMAKADDVLGRLEGRPYVGEMWKRYGEILFDQTRYPDSINVLKRAIAKYPNAPYNPSVQARIVAAYERLRDFDSATVERETLVASYDQSSGWHDANRENIEAIALAADLTEKSVYTAAIYNHQQAQAYKSGGRPTAARDSYRRAAVGYETYLRNFPQSKNAYEFRFYLAECLYYSDAFGKAAVEYATVRDSNEDNKHLEAAAVSTVVSYEKDIERLEASGKLIKSEFTTAAQRDDRPIAPKTIPPIRLELVKASDRFQQLLPTSERVPPLMYRAAEVYYKHDQFEEARRRFEKIVVDHPGTEVARFSANLIIESYLASKDWDSVETWSQRLIEVAAKSPKGKAQAELVASLKKFKVGARFKKAEAADAAGRYEEAAGLYVGLVDESPKHQFADKALFNAAVAYEKVRLFDAASRVYQRIYDKYPRSKLADRALFRVGVNYEKGFDFAGAISAYTKLVERYPKSPHRADSLYNVAVTLENMQQYGQAAGAFKRYAVTFPSREDAGEMYFRAAVVYEKMKAWPETISTLTKFISRYGRRSKQKTRVVEAHKKVGDAYAAQRKTRSAARAYVTCVREFDRLGFGPRDKASKFAGECAFETAENLFRRYDAVKLVGTGRKQKRSLIQKAKLQREVEKTYQRVFQYKRVETTLAASYRIGFSYERFAEAMLSAEIPPEFKKDEELADAYKLQLEEQAGVLERKAESAYRKAFEEARKTRVSNEWTQRILEGLNKYKPDEFPVQKAGLKALQTFTITAHGLDTLDAEPRTSGSKPSAQAPGGSR